MSDVFRTTVSVSPSQSTVDYKTNSVLLGSCFTENIGQRLLDKKLPTEVNPFGILYNPSSVAKSIFRLLENRFYTEEELFYSNEQWHSFDHHSRFSNNTVEDTLSGINNSYSEGHKALVKAKHLFVTFGTAYVYKDSASDKVVSNCHKLPAKQFVRYRLSTEQIVEEWVLCLEKVFEANPKCRVVFTVSPIRHMRDGSHENQLSKSTLLLAIDQLVSRFGDKKIAYFAAFEIMMDDLRDYRFYASDMLHPSGVAIDYIWEKFAHCYFNDQTVQHMKQIDKFNSLLYHRPFNQKSDKYQQTITNTLDKLDRYQEQYNYLKLDEIRNQLMEKRSF